MKRMILALSALSSLALAAPAQAKAVTDCPLRNMPFSAKSPLIDLLRSDAARAILFRATNGLIDKVPAGFMATEPPTFAAILTLKEAAAFAGLTPAQVDSVDAELQALPVTRADKVARCVRYDNEVPTFDLPRERPHLLLFEKINGFKDEPSVHAAHAALLAMAERKGWAVAVTDKGGAFNSSTLRQFDAVVWNNVSGDVLTLSQRRAFQRYMRNGGGFVALHGSAGDPSYFWDWYADTLIGARFMGHPMGPQFQAARIVVNRNHQLAGALPNEWTMNDEWYSFRTNPRQTGATVLLTLDESTYKPIGLMAMDIRMGDHPIAWTNCIGKGRMFYSAIGHRPETYDQPQHVAMLEAAIDWVATDRKACPAKAARN